MPRHSSVGKRPAFAALLALVLLLTLQQHPSAGASFTDSDADGASDLVEGVFGSDPADAARVPETADYPFVPGSTSCTDTIDNDGDGQNDAEDEGCIDSDGSYPSDATETILGSDPHNDESFPEDSRFDTIFRAQGYLAFTCGDQSDNDGDGLIDAADPGCAPIDADADGFDDFVEKTLGSDWENGASEPEHVTVNPGSCADAVDNDGDGPIDGTDDGCATAPNDDFADAIDVALPFVHSAKVGAATVELGERQGSCLYSEDSERSTVWYKFSAPSDGPVIIDTTGTDLLAGVVVWREDTFGLAEVDCNSSFFYFNVSSRFAFAASSGATYFIQVERISTDLLGLPVIDLGRLSFIMESTSPPANDDLVDAQQIASLPFATSADTVAATTEPSERDGTCSFDPYLATSVWYRYTHSVDEYVLASVTSADFSITLAAFEGASLGSLQQIACGNDLAFQAQAGHTYYLQAGGYSCHDPTPEVQAASFCIAVRGGHFELQVEAFELPACAPPRFTYADPVGDTKPHVDVPEPIDITSISMAFGGGVACVTVGVASQVDQEHVWLAAYFDADLDRNTGDRVSTWDQCGPLGVGADFETRAEGIDGLLANVYSAVDGSAYGYVTYSDVSLTLIVPMSSIGGDDTLRLAIETLYGFGSSSAHFSDCGPNGGNITCQDGACDFSPFRNGDANCSGPADAIDALIVLQYDAGLLDALACPDAADVTGDALIDSRDALLVLQFTAGLIIRLPPPPPPPCFEPPC